jgi:phosphoribosylaminoimidazole-succinocarboxamide synthase
MAAAGFEALEKRGILTHYKGLIVDGKVIGIDGLRVPTNVMEVNLFNVIKPVFADGKYDYSGFWSTMTNFVVPLEIIYRNSLPEGSSVFKRLKNGTLSVEDLDLIEMPVPGYRFKEPFFDIGTKFEQEDIYLSWEKAAKMAALHDYEVVEMKEILAVVNQVTNELCAKAGLTNEDGKIEMAFDDQGRFRVVDAVSTLDECRFMSGGVHVSKEAIRKYYRKTPWFEATERAKIKARELGVADWRPLCGLEPEPLPDDLTQMISDLYTGTANAFVGRAIFDSPNLQDTIKKYKDWLTKVA